MDNQFSIGDRVRIINASDHKPSVWIGREGVVVGIDEGLKYCSIVCDEWPPNFHAGRTPWFHEWLESTQLIIEEDPW